MSVVRTTIAGIPIPDSALARDATEFVQDVSTQLLFDHSRRVFLWGSLQGEKLGLDYDPDCSTSARCSTTWDSSRVTAPSTSASRSTAPTPPALSSRATASQSSKS